MKTIFKWLFYLMIAPITLICYFFKCVFIGLVDSLDKIDDLERWICKKTGIKK